MSTLVASVRKSFVGHRLIIAIAAAVAIAALATSLVVVYTGSGSASNSTPSQGTSGGTSLQEPCGHTNAFKMPDGLYLHGC
jgi:hypothetical protein